MFDMTLCAEYSRCLTDYIVCVTYSRSLFLYVSGSKCHVSAVLGDISKKIIIIYSKNALTKQYQRFKPYAISYCYNRLFQLFTTVFFKKTSQTKYLIHCKLKTTPLHT